VEKDIETSGASTGTVSKSSMGPRRLIPFILLVVLTLGAGLTALLSASSSASASTAVRAALDSTMNAKSVTFTMNVDLSGTLAAKASLGGSCATGPQCQMAFSASSGGSSIGESHLVIDQGMVYLELSGSLASKFPTPWISSPINTTGSSQSTGLSTRGNLSSVLAGFSKVGDNVNDLGIVTLNGASMHEYSVSASQAVEQQQIASVLKSVPSGATSSLSTATVDGYSLKIYVDSDGRVAEVDLATSFTTLTGTESLALTISLYGYGDPVSVTVPPANEVTPLSSLLTTTFTGL
jgi:hypothetical protein